jgi:hypothetical protein
MPAVSRRVHYQVSFSPPPDKCNYVEKCSSMGFMLAACTLDLEIRVRVHGSLLNLRADYSEGVSMCHGRLKVTVFNQTQIKKIVSERALLAPLSLSITLTLIVLKSCLSDSNRTSWIVYLSY